MKKFICLSVSLICLMSVTYGQFLKWNNCFNTQRPVDLAAKPMLSQFLDQDNLQTPITKLNLFSPRPETWKMDSLVTYNLAGFGKFVKK